jgi:hypothetical protein
MGTIGDDREDRDDRDDRDKKKRRSQGRLEEHSTPTGRRTGG